MVLFDYPTGTRTAKVCDFILTEVYFLQEAACMRDGSREISCNHRNIREGIKEAKLRMYVSVPVRRQCLCEGTN